MIRVNVGSGQRRFEGHGWINADCVSREGQVPDVIMNALERWPWGNGEVDMVCMHQSLEHLDLQQGAAALREAYRVLKPGGSLLIFLPNLRTLAQRWLTRGISDYIYIVNLMGAYISEESDRHKWHYTPESLKSTLESIGEWSAIKPFDWRPIPGASLANDFWVQSCEAVK